MAITTSRKIGLNDRKMLFLQTWDSRLLAADGWRRRRRKRRRRRRRKKWSIKENDIT